MAAAPTPTPDNMAPPAAPKKSFWLFRRRTLTLVLVFALLFTAIAPKPANALAAAAIAAAVVIVVKTVADGTTEASWAGSMATSVRIAVRAYFHMLMESIRANGKFKAAKGVAEYKNFTTKLALIAGLQVENISSPNKSTCRGTTAHMRENRARAGASLIAGSLGGSEDLLGLRPRDSGSTRSSTRSGSGSGAGSGAAAGAGGPTNSSAGLGPGANGPAAGTTPAELVPGGNSKASAIRLAAESCKYAEDTEANRKRCEQLGVTGSDFAKYPGMNVNASVLLDTAAYDNAAHAEAALAYCKNLTVNTEMEIATERVSMQSADKRTKNVFLYGEAANASLAKYICNEVFATRVPLKPDNTPDYTAPNTAETRYNGLYRSYLKNQGWQPLSVDQYNSWPPAPSAANPAPTSYSANMYYVPGRAPSLRQREIFNQSGLYDDTRVLGAGVSATAPLRHNILAKAVTISQNMQRFRMLERELLFEAIQLGRKVNKKG